jgi:hypothetical protein
VGGLWDGHAAGGLVVRPGAEGKVNAVFVLCCSAFVLWILSGLIE